MILLSRVNSPLKLIQNVPTRPCCILSVNSRSSSLCLYLKPWQAETLSHVQMERSSHHCSVNLIVLVLDFFASPQLLKAGGKGWGGGGGEGDLCALLRVAVGGKTARTMQASSSLTGIKWPLHRGLHMWAGLCEHTHALSQRGRRVSEQGQETIYSWISK